MLQPQLIKRTYSDDKLFIFSGIVISIIGIYLSYLALHDQEHFPDALSIVAFYGIYHAPLFLGVGLLGLGLKWKRSIVISALSLCSLGILSFLLFLASLFFNFYPSQSLGT